MAVSLKKQMSGVWDSVSDLGWLFQVQLIVFGVAGSFSPAVWNYPFMILAGCVSAAWLNARAPEYAYIREMKENAAYDQLEEPEPFDLRSVMDES